jgi:cell division protein ZapA (FtsZ GTPase activity inhibitor)
MHMSQPAISPAAAAPSTARVEAKAGARVPRPFCGVIDPVLVNEPVLFPFGGSVSADAAASIWTWVARDLCPDLISGDGVANGNFGAADLEPLMPEIMSRMKAAVEKVDRDNEALRRLRAQSGRDNFRDEVAVVMAALKARALLPKAQGFGKAVNSMSDDAALGVALQSMPLKDPVLAALLFHAAMGQIANPTRLITSVIKLSGNAGEQVIARNGFSPLLDAVLAHAQNQLKHLQLNGPFADIDMVCRSLERFHRLVRSLTGYVEFARGSRATQVLSTITKMVSDRVEPRLKEVATDLNQAMRRPREGADRIDNDRLLGAINGVYLLSSVRDCRDSLALNAVFDQAWSQTGQALELHIQRNLDLLRQNPGDAMTGARLDAAIKMAEVRFNADYADTLRRARATAERRA